MKGEVSIEDACELVTDGTHYTPKNEGVGIPFLTVRDVSARRLDFEGCSFISREEYEAAKRGNSAPQKGDLLFSKDGTVGKVHVVETDRPFAVLSSLAILRPRLDRVDGRYLAHALRSPKILERAISRKTGSAVRRIILSDLKKIYVPLPSLEQQRRIAQILDKADELRAKRRVALAQLDTLTQSIFLDMFGDVAADSGRWPIEPLERVVRSGTIVTYGIVQAGDEHPGGVPYIRTGDIVDGAIEVSGLRRTDPEIAAKFDRSRVRAGDIVMSIRATVGTTAVVPPELEGANLTQGTAKISPGDRVSVDYLLNYLRTPGTQHWIGRQIKGATFREITLARLRELPVAVPPIERQQAFGVRARAALKLVALHRAGLSQLDALFASLQHRAFCGEL